MHTRHTITREAARICYFLALLGLAALSALVWSPAEESVQRPTPADAPRAGAHALLVGVTTYPSNDGLPPLEGPPMTSS